MSEFHVDGVVLDTTIPRLIHALSGPEWSIQDRDEKLRVKADGVSIDIYDHAPYGNARQYLIGGRIYHDLASTRSLVDVMASRLHASGISYRIELTDERGEEVTVFEHGSSQTP